MWVKSVEVYWPFVNHVSREYIDPVLSLFAVTGSKQFAYVELAIFFLTLSILFNQVFIKGSCAQSFRAILFSAILALPVAFALLLLTGPNPFLLSIHVVPLTILFVLKRGKWPDYLTYPAVFALNGHYVFCNGPVAFAGLICIWGGAWLCRRMQFTKKHQVTAHYKCARNNLIEVSILFFWLCVAFLGMPRYEMPDYPAEARLAPISKLSSSLSISRLGEWLNPNPVVYERMMEISRSHFRRYVVLMAITIFCFFAYMGWSSSWRNINVMPIICFTIIGVVLCSDYWMPEYLSAWSPGSSFRRIIPGLPLEVSNVVLLPLFFLFGIVAQLQYILVAILQTPDSVSSNCKVLGSLLTLSVILLSLAWGALPTESLNKYFHAQPVVSAADSMKYSPSGYVIETISSSLSNVDEASKHRRDTLEAINLTGANISASVRNEFAFKMTDGQVDTIWSTGRAAQKGDWILLDLQESKKVAAIELSPGKAHTDFPRGLAIYVSSDGSNYAKIFRQDDWQGEVRWTKRGYPYFVGQQFVKINLPGEIVTRFIRIEQTAQTELYNWSISEFKLYRLLPQ